MQNECPLYNLAALPYYYKQKQILNQLKKDVETEKRKSAFKPISYSYKFDVGKPQNVVIEKVNRVSEFRKVLLKGYIPLRMVLFGNKDVTYWSVPLEKLPVHRIFSCLVEGLSDKNELYQRMALSALKNIILRWDKEDLLKWIPNCITSLQLCIRTMKCSNITKALAFLTCIIHSHHLSANAFLPYITLIFRPINYFFRKDYFNSSNNENEDNKKAIMALRTDFWEFFRDFELCCYPNELEAYHNIKTVLPIYESMRFCDVKI